jgi:hypothetical protein
MKLKVKFNNNIALTLYTGKYSKRNWEIILFDNFDCPLFNEYNGGEPIPTVFETLEAALKHAKIYNKTFKENV